MTGHAALVRAAPRTSILGCQGTPSILLVAALSGLFLVALAAAPATAAPAQPTPSPNPLVVTPSFVTEIQRRLDRIERSAEDREKDFWDKLNSASGLSTGVLVALIGGVATYVFNRRQQVAEDLRKDREIQVQRIQTVETFIEHLASDDERNRRAAFLAIHSLGDTDLAARLAEVYGGPGALAALSEIATEVGVTAGGSTRKGTLLHTIGLAESSTGLLITAEKVLHAAVVDDRGVLLTLQRSAPKNVDERASYRLANGARREARLVRIVERIAIWQLTDVDGACVPIPLLPETRERELVPGVELLIPTYPEERSPSGKPVRTKSLTLSKIASVGESSEGSFITLPEPRRKDMGGAVALTKDGHIAGMADRYEFRERPDPPHEREVVGVRYLVARDLRRALITVIDDT